MLLFKYTIEIDGCMPADPPIIIEKEITVTPC